ncbi:DNA-deoxyinosine glycosylase [Cloacibacillus evryensis]|uniref:DNA-deoxyinosine glycosylase n=1 Tax=Cloacibacillus evryensis TaxID=508460 RepID=UPI0004ADD4D1|nr:DNA-deoxyinosine glycosylase [Cloacibacillus evryensis]MCQ4763564.1 DNA-deoxyinosine glycosylase [Cloacibacillus evryensis]MEA5034124.1 DNA-deoxyinosine glycosylase [Cloacibacillus evryensis]
MIGKKGRVSQKMKYSFGPVINDSSRTLILGSLPGEKSLAMSSYYAHPQNHFWKILYRVFGETMPDSFQERYDFILRRRLALWDTIKCARRAGSLDGKIRDEEPNDVPSLLALHPNISLILFNGACAFAKYKKYFGEPARHYRRMLSTSPACAGRNDERYRMWEEALRQGTGR